MLIWSPAYNTDLSQYGFDKPFALDRGELVLRSLESEARAKITCLTPEPISLADAALVHSQDYLDMLFSNEIWHEIFELKEDELRPEKQTKPLHKLLDDILLKCGGTMLACREALKAGLACNMGGGYHHAFPERGRGFCVLNDIAIAIIKLKIEKKINKVMIVDLDFHQGDGCALIFKEDPDVFTLSVHSEEGWPEEKQESDLDVPLRSEEQGLYFEKVENALEHALSLFKPDFCLYVAGSDPFELDSLPGTRFLRLSLETLRLRDEFVIDTFFQRKIPLAMVFAGGYGPEVWRVHHQAVRHMLCRLGRLGNLSG